MIATAQQGEYNIPDVDHYDELEAPCSQCVFPVEILEKIIEYCYYNGDINQIYSINSNTQQFHKSLASVNSTFYLLSLKYSYRYANFTRSTSFHSFLNTLKKVRNLGDYVHFIDFMEFTSIGLGRTAQMMQEIQMVTSKTILEALQLTPNLLEFLASESIENDIDSNIVHYLFNNLMHLQALDFCGSSGMIFRNAFERLVITRDFSDSSIHKLSFHDCTELTNGIFENIISKLNLTRLDLTHTQITINSLSRSLNINSRLTHLSIGKCSQIGTTRDIIAFLTQHPAVNQGTLQWLSLQVDTTMESPFNDLTLKYLLTNLNAPYLKYLNLSGIKVTADHLDIISERFLHLRSIVLSHSQLNIDELTTFLRTVDNLRFLDICGNKTISRWTLENQFFLTACPKLIAIEVDNHITTTINETRINGLLKIYNNKSQNNDYWKTFDNNGQGRRSWIFKLNNEEKEQESKGQPIKYNNNIIYFDLKTGEKILKKVKFPAFLKFASKKINVSNGLFYNSNSDAITGYDDLTNDTENVISSIGDVNNSATTSSNNTAPNTYANTNANANNEPKPNENTANSDPDIPSYITNNVFPVEFSQRGIYKYYSLSR